MAPTTLTFDNSIRAVLARIVADGVTEPRRIRSLLADLAPAAVAERHVLLVAAEEGVPDALITGQAFPDITTARLIKQLQEQRALTIEAAQWAVETWGLVLGCAVASPAPPPGPTTSLNLTMDRRGFLRTCGSLVAMSVVPSVVFPLIKQRLPSGVVHAINGARIMQVNMLVGKNCESYINALATDSLKRPYVFRDVLRYDLKSEDILYLNTTYARHRDRGAAWFRDVPVHHDAIITMDVEIVGDSSTAYLSNLGRFQKSMYPWIIIDRRGKRLREEEATSFYWRCGGKEGYLPMVLQSLTNKDMYNRPGGWMERGSMKIMQHYRGYVYLDFLVHGDVDSQPLHNPTDITSPSYIPRSLHA